MTLQDVLTAVAIGLGASLAAVVVILLWAKVVASVAGFIWGLW